MAEIRESRKVAGVKFAHLHSFADERGRFVETFRKSWFPERSWDIVQANRSDSQAGVLRGLHYHFNQVDYWYPLAGRIRIALFDLRVGSRTEGASQVLDLSDEDGVGVFVPVGVAHGFLALTDCTLTYLVDNYYDDTDEHGIAWNDPDVGIPWKIKKPELSDRDRRNPHLRDIPKGRRPKA